MEKDAVLTEVYLREEKKRIRIAITGPDKPELSDLMLQRWQKIINTAARILHVPAGLIMKITPETMEVFLSSETAGNPYIPAASDLLGHGLYCETVIGRNSLFLIEDSLNNQAWQDNPDVKLGMISYLGFPILWPDGEMFGTICVLDRKTSSYTSDQIELLGSFKNLIEMDLEREIRNRDLQEANDLHDLRMRELHHLMKNQFNILSSIIQLKADTASNDVQNALDDVDVKLRNAALLHSKIYRSDKLTPNLVEYIRDVIRSTLASYEIPMDLQITGECTADAEHYLDFGLIFSELVTNTIKYGLRDGRRQISVQFYNDTIQDKTVPSGSNHLRIVYRDNGPGFSESALNGEGKKGLGSMLTDAFILRSKGTVRRYNDGGAVTEFTLYPLHSHE